MIYALARPFLFTLDPETAHRAAIAALQSGLTPHAPASDPKLRRTVMGLDFPNPLGLAAGFDKNAEVVDAALALGFGFVEVGSVTPKPQPGNPKPRVFRSVADRAIINRLGFNSEGHDAVHARLAKRRSRGIVGVNLGANKDSDDRVADYALGVTRFSDVASYLAINISSPNTPGLRDLQEREGLTRLTGAIAEARERASRRVPIVVKVAPDLDDEALAAIVETMIAAGMDGMIISNTTLSRVGLSQPGIAAEAGGMSGRPLFAPSNKMLTRVRALAGTRLALIGTGGIDSVGAARQKLIAGADLIQLYTGMVYEGPELPARIVAGLAQAG
ncbi:MAG TPA: quinone-dependent dihydroorotate dehydrogenase [Bauldia sp.]|nr:quinone-dependent dihydroorotate dehydrogenase [Bauldia sp.]